MDNELGKRLDDVLRQHQGRIHEDQVERFLDETRGRMSAVDRAHIVSRVWFPLTPDAVRQRDHRKREPGPPHNPNAPDMFGTEGY